MIQCMEATNPLENNPLFSTSGGAPWGSGTTVLLGPLPKFFGYQEGASHFTSIWRYLNIGSRSVCGEPVLPGPTTKMLGRGGVYFTLAAGVVSYGVITACAVQCYGGG